VEEVGGAPVVTSIKPQASVSAASVSPRPTTTAPPLKSAVQAAMPKPLAAAAVAEGINKGTPLIAPMPGMVVRHEKSVGDEVKPGDVVLILEAMKMENSITAPAAGKLVATHCERGQQVRKGAVLAVIA
jgi:biotin carboxyl carrier protein